MAAAKTNAMRILEQKKTAYTAREYPHGPEAVDGVTVAGLLGLPAETVFKTLVTRGGHDIFVFVIPVAEELDLKKAAKAVGAKAVEMVKVSEINGLTGYIRGGCSPVGMKKLYTTVFDESALRLESVTVSGGRIGCQITLAPADLMAVVRGRAAQLTK